MNKTTIVAFLLLFSNHISANTLMPEINKIESEWANIYYNKSNSVQGSYFPELLNTTERLCLRHPKAVELKIWQAIIIATNAAFESPFTALESINKAKKILEQTIKDKPTALGGAALVTLGTLYYMTPGWPISFGDQQKAEQLLKRALKINPNSIDSNYFYADFLLNKGDLTKAEKYFKLALNAPSRKKQIFADEQLKKEAKTALLNTELRKLNSGKNRFLSLFTSAKSN